MDVGPQRDPVVSFDFWGMRQLLHVVNVVRVSLASMEYVPIESRFYVWTKKLVIVVVIERGFGGYARPW